MNADRSLVLAVLARAVLGLAGMLLLYVLALMSLAVPPILAVLVVAGLGLSAARRTRWWTSHGSACWASLSHLRNAGMVGQGGGLLLGKTNQVPTLGQAAWGLVTAPLRESGLACALLFAALRRNPNQVGQWVRMKRGTHVAVFSPTGRGKTTAFTLPNLLDHKGSVVVIDPDGTVAPATLGQRRRMGQRVVLLDPFHAVTTTPDRFNALDLIDAASHDALDLCRALAVSLVVRDEGEKERHWNDSAEIFLWSFIALVVHHYPPGHGDRHLGTVVSLLADSTSRAGAIAMMQQSSAYGGGLAQLGHQLTHYGDKEGASVLTTTLRHVSLITSPAVAACLKATSFEPRRIKDGMTIYLVMKPQFLRSHAAFLRLVITGLLQAVVRAGPDESKQVLWLFEEAAALGDLPCVSDAVTQLRKYGVRMCFLFQSVGQLRKCYPDGGDVVFLANMDVTLYAGLNDYATAEQVSQRLGEATIAVGQTSWGTSRSFTADLTGHQSQTWGDNAGGSEGPHGRPLLRPEEVLGLDERTAIVFAPGVPPLWTRWVRHYEAEFEKDFRGPGNRKGLGLVFRAVVLGIVAAALACLATAWAFTPADPGVLP